MNDDVIDIRERLGESPACPNCGGREWTEMLHRFECDACGFRAFSQLSRPVGDLRVSAVPPSPAGRVS
jgi:ribosomal protein S27AE